MCYFVQAQKIGHKKLRPLPKLQSVNQLLLIDLEFIQMPKDKPWLGREACLYDLDGNKLILYDAGENRLNLPWRIREEK